MTRAHRYRKGTRTEEIAIRVLSFLGLGLVRLLGRTARCRVSGEERVRELLAEGRGFIVIAWHGLMLMPVYYCRNMGLCAITSLSRDGEVQTRIMSDLGYNTVRGSTRRGGAEAALAACRKIRAGVPLAITPDGPLGPSREVQSGAAFIAKKTGCPVVPIGVGIRPRIRMPTWDRYSVPLPFARWAIVFGDPVYPAEENGGPMHESLERDLKLALDEAQRRAERLLRT